MAKKKNRVSLEVIGGNNESVTGSCTKISFNDRTILFECGGIMDGHTILQNYNLNKDLIKSIKAKNVDMIILGHCHYDHISNICSIVSKNPNIRVIAPKGSTPILKEMWLDSAFINARDCDFLNLHNDSKSYQPLYTEDDVYTTLSKVEEFPSHEIIALDDEVSIRYTPAGHILCSQQCEVFINGGSHTRKVLFTSDIGNTITQDEHIFVEPMERVKSAEIAIVECTYSKRGRGMNKKDLVNDLNKLESVITQYCVDGNFRVLIPTFSLDRMPFMMWEIYKIFGKDDSFKVPIIIDSPLANRLLDCYSSILEEDAKEKFDEMMEWKNFKRIIMPEDSIAAMKSEGAKVILSSSGMLTAGRSVNWVKDILPHAEDCVMFIGYSAESSLANIIKHGSDKKSITINGSEVKNRANIVDLKSFSSHTQRKELLDYYKDLNVSKIYLVHSNKNDKLEFKEDLEKKLSECCKSTRVIAVNKSTVINI